MLVSRHVVISFPVAALVYFFTKSLSAGFICFFVGAFLDVDHFLDYLLHFGWRGFSCEKCYQSFSRIRMQQENNYLKRVYLFLHSNEIAILLWLFAFYRQSIYLFAAAAGYTIHLLLDYIGNPIYPYTYFFIWRYLNKFQIDKVLKRKINS